MKYILILIALLFAQESQAAKFPTVTFSADGTKVVAVIPRSQGTWEATVKAFGTWGSGTIAWSQSDDSACSSTVALYDQSTPPTAVTSTADDMFNVNLGIDRDNYTYLCATLSDSTNPDIDVIVKDNR